MAALTATQLLPNLAHSLHKMYHLEINTYNSLHLNEKLRNTMNALWISILTFRINMQLQTLDSEITSSMLDAESSCTKRRSNKYPWSPKLMLASRTLSYWKQKHHMVLKQSIRWPLLESYKILEITMEEHNKIELTFVKNKLWEARWQWFATHKEAADIWKKILQERADDYTMHKKILAERALKAIKRSERSWRDFIQIRNIIGQ